MFKVMIVDDEYYVVSLIKNLIDWSTYNMTIAGTADNGVTALSEVKRIKPDIVIVDVRMPGYDGITFMQKVREIDTHIKFIVISGHKKFEYAKNAIQYDIEDYLTKPICKNELEAILVKLKKKLELEQQSENFKMALYTELNNRQDQIQNYFLESFFTGQFLEKDLIEDELNQIYFVDLKKGYYQAVVVKPDFSHTNLDSNFIEMVLGEMKTGLSQFAEDSPFRLLIYQAPDSIYGIVNCSKGNEKEMRATIETYYDGVEEILKEYKEVFLTVGIGGLKDSLLEALFSLQEAKYSIQARIALGTGRIISFEDLKEEPKVIQNILSETVQNKWIEAIQSFQIENIKIQLLSIFSEAQKLKYQDNLIYNKMVTVLLKSFYDYLVQLDFYRNSFSEMGEEFARYGYWVHTEGALAETFIKYMNYYLAEYISEENPNLNPAIKVVKNYIAENYQKNISMSSMAELVNLSPVYFSVLFKREVGTNFSDYLNQHRLEASKKLLKQIKYNINEVATMCGFPNSKYFSKLFKKVFGITPTEYRKRNAA